MIWPAAALSVSLLGFVVLYGSALQSRVERRVPRLLDEPSVETAGALIERKGS
jgi:hypothetical protein